MKLQETYDGGWELKHRSYFGLCLGLIILGSIPFVVASEQDNSMVACIILSFLGIMCLWGFAEFSVVKITKDGIGYVRHFVLFRQTVYRSRSTLLSVSLETRLERHSTSKRIKFSFSSGKPIVIPKAFVGSTLGWTIHDVYQAVRNILPELKQDSSDEILSLVAEGYKIQAIDLVRRQYGMDLSEAKVFVEDLKPGNVR